MKQTIFTLVRTRKLTADVYELTLSGNASSITAPGQFVNLALPGKFLRRPISVCDWTDTSVTLLVRAVGAGTRELISLAPETKLDVLCGLGNGFDLSRCGPHPILIGGGIGAAPLFGLARRLLDRGIVPTAALGFRTAGDAFYMDEFSALGCRVLAATEDGTLGQKGFVTDLVRSVPECEDAFVCGPTAMLRAVSALDQLRSGQFSLEARMACGFGACVGCTIQTAGGPRRVCKDGPVFEKEALVW